LNSHVKRPMSAQALNNIMFLACDDARIVRGKGKSDEAQIATAVIRAISSGVSESDIPSLEIWALARQ